MKNLTWIALIALIILVLFSQYQLHTDLTRIADSMEAIATNLSMIQANVAG